jgi:hypothetical protein
VRGGGAGWDAVGHRYRRVDRRVPVALLDMLYQRAVTDQHTVGQHTVDTGRSIASSPSKTTVWRVLTGADPGAVNTAIGAWLFTHAVHATDTADPAEVVAQVDAGFPPVMGGMV